MTWQWWPTGFRSSTCCGAMMWRVAVLGCQDRFVCGKCRGETEPA